MASEGLPKTWQEFGPWIVTIVIVAFIDHFLGDVYEWFKEICVKNLVALYKVLSPLASELQLHDIAETLGKALNVVYIVALVIITKSTVDYFRKTKARSAK
jgi:hypothetical protein